MRTQPATADDDHQDSRRRRDPALRQPGRRARCTLCADPTVDPQGAARRRAGGYAFTFSHEAFDDVARFVANERRCCPFLNFTIELAPPDGALTLRLTRPEGTRAFLEAEMELGQSNRERRHMGPKTHRNPTLSLLRLSPDVPQSDPDSSRRHAPIRHVARIRPPARRQVSVSPNWTSISMSDSSQPAELLDIAVQ